MRARLVTLGVVLIVALFVVWIVSLNRPVLGGETGNVPDKLVDRNTVTQVDGSTVDIEP